MFFDDFVLVLDDFDFGFEVGVADFDGDLLEAGGVFAIHAMGVIKFIGFMNKI